MEKSNPSVDLLPAPAFWAFNQVTMGANEQQMDLWTPGLLKPSPPQAHFHLGRVLTQSSSYRIRARPLIWRVSEPLDRPIITFSAVCYWFRLIAAIILLCIIKIKQPRSFANCLQPMESSWKCPNPHPSHLFPNLGSEIIFTGLQSKTFQKAKAQNIIMCKCERARWKTHQEVGMEIKLHIWVLVIWIEGSYKCFLWTPRSDSWF